MKYELIPDQDSGLFRVRALRDVRPGVPAGTVGGLVESERNLAHEGMAWVSGNAKILGNARVYGNAEVSGNAFVSGNAWVTGDAAVAGYAVVSDDALVFGDAEVSGNAVVSGNARVSGDAWVTGNAVVSGDAEVTKVTHVINTVGLPSGNATLCRTRFGHRVSIGCWSGTVDELRAMIAKDSGWPEATGDEIDRRRPMLEGLADFYERMAQSW